MAEHSSYVGRLAPSPTGLLHLGHAATFLIAHDRARAAGGRLWLRIDNLDAQRSKEVYVDALRDDLSWLGFTWDDELLQSTRLSRYRAAMEQLLSQKDVYPCTCSRKDLRGATQAPHEELDDEPLYNGHCRPIGEPGKTTGQWQLTPGWNFRFRVPEGEAVSFQDLNFGRQSFTAGVDFGDFLVWRKDGLPSYQLATIVDDADTGITEIVRGQDLLKSTARQILLWRALRLPQPRFFHTELLRDAGGQRLAKRHDSLSLQTLRSQGETSAQIRARVRELLHPSKT